MITSQLQNPDFRFILVKEKDKIPIENYWQCPTLKAATDKWGSEKNDAEKVNKPFTKEKPTRVSQYRFDDPILLEHQNKGGNIGIVCGIGGLIVADIDKPIEDLTPPNTLTIDTPSNGKHYYLICNELTKKIILEQDGIHYGEIQAGGNTQIITPGCTAKSKITQEYRHYTITNDKPIITLTIDGLKDLFGNYIKKTAKKDSRQIFADERFTLSIDRLINISKFRQRGSEYQGEHPVHGSTGGANFCVNTSKNVWHCFRHDCGGGALELLAQIEGIIECGGKLTNDQFNLAIKIGQEKYGLIQKKPATPADVSLLVFQLLAQNKNDEATEIIVHDILGRNHIYTVRDDKAPEIWIYHDGVYIPHGKTYILEECRKIFEKSFNMFLAGMVVNKIMTDTYIEAVEFFKPAIGDWVAVKNGQLNPFTRELKDFSPKDIHFTKLPVEYKPGVDCPNIKSHFKEITAHESDILVLEEASGWFLLNEYKPERAIMLSGTGRNGKTKTIGMWKEFLGVENISTIALHQFEQDQYAAGDLLNKRANLAGDIDSEMVKNTALFKQVTGRDPISSNRKYLSRIKFNNNAKMVCAANELPNTRDLSIGFFGRWILIDFPYRFATPQEIETFSDGEKAYAKIADLDIINKLTTPEELTGLLNLALDGLDRLMKQGDFSTSRTTEQVKQEWLKRSDSFGSFINSYLQEEYGASISKQELRHVYKSYCQNNKLRIASDKIIKNKMSELLGAFEARRSDTDSRVMVWDGVTWNEAGQEMARVSRVSRQKPKVLITRIGTFENTPDTLATLASEDIILEILNNGWNDRSLADLRDICLDKGISSPDFVSSLQVLLDKGLIYQPRGEGPNKPVIVTSKK